MRGAGGHTPSHQPAENDAVGLRQPRFELAVDVLDGPLPIPAAARCGRQTRSGTLPDNRRAAPSGRCDDRIALQPPSRSSNAPTAPSPAGHRTPPRRRAGRATMPSAPCDGIAQARLKSYGLMTKDFRAAQAPPAAATINCCARSSSSSREPRSAVRRGAARTPRAPRAWQAQRETARSRAPGQ